MASPVDAAVADAKKDDRTLIWAIIGLSTYDDTEYLKPGRLRTCLQTHYSVYSNGLPPVEDITFETGERCSSWQ